MTPRREMTLADWLNSAVNLILGLLLGMAAYGLAELLNAGLWLTALLVILPFLGLVALVSLMEGLFERLFPSGVRPARSPSPKVRRPLPLLLSMPMGFALGLITGVLGISGRVLEVL